ncbi:MAG: hypothetical protein RMK29_10160 [Myxococcales bacterium]|nr:hypothetical protein [Myxococcota bacterium]MDW8282066.1 hypothetical protein [Myxococcales bacterium]
MLTTRAELLQPGRLRALLSRVGMVAPPVLSCVALRDLLPALQPQLLDAELLALQVWLFGDTPARLPDHIASPPVVGWFAFLYSYFYSYFALPVLHGIGSLCLDDQGRRRYEMPVGATLVTAAGHTVYTLVPGVGPHASMAFACPSEGGFALVLEAVKVPGRDAQYPPIAAYGILDAFRDACAAASKAALIPQCFAFCGAVCCPHRRAHAAAAVA